MSPSKIKDYRKAIAKLEANIKVCKKYKSSVSTQLGGAAKQKWLNKYNQHIKRYKKEISRLNIKITKLEEEYANDRQKLGSVKKTLEENISLCKEYKKEVNKKLRGRMREEWINKYDDYIQRYAEQISKCKKEVKKASKPKTLSERLDDSESAIKTLERNISLCHKYKSKVEKHLSGKEKHTWIQTYDDFIKKYTTELKKQKTVTQVTKLRKRELEFAPAITIAAALIIMAFIVVPNSNLLTGLAVVDLQEPVYVYDELGHLIGSVQSMQAQAAVNIIDIQPPDLIYDEYGNQITLPGKSKPTQKLKKPDTILDEEGYILNFPLNLSIKDKNGTEIGSYKVKKKGSKYNLVISEAAGFVISAATTNVNIIGITQIPDNLTAKIDYTNDEKITTKVFTLEAKKIINGVAQNIANPITFDNATITLPKTGDVNAIMRCDAFEIDNFTCASWQKTDIHFTDNGDSITFTVDHFSGYAGADLTVLNVQSFPVVGGNWTVEFTTTGTANLTITAVDNTTWTDYAETGYDLKFLELKCGNTTLNYSWINNETGCATGNCSVFYEDYTCNETGYETSKVFTTGKHKLQFMFGDDIEYAYNLATANLSCITRQTACNSDETGVLRMSNTSNAHAELINGSDYDYVVCCKDTDGRNTLSNSSGTILIDLSADTDAHAEQPGETDYGYSVYLDASVDNLTCTYESVSGSCTGNRTCLFTLSNTTDAHVADCTTDPYSLSVCCEFQMLNAHPTHDTPYLGAHQPTESTADDNLVGYWQFEHKDNKENKAFDALGINNGTLNGGPTHTDDGRIGSAYVFDGTDDYVSISGSVEDGDASMFAWIYQPDTSASNCVGSRCTVISSPSHNLFEVFGGAVYIYGYDFNTPQWVTINSVINSGQWHHVGFTYNQSSLRVYVNGADVGGNNNVPGTMRSMGTLNIGVLTTGLTRYFNGTIDEVMTYNRTLSASEILEMYLDAEINSSSTVTSDQDLGASSNNTVDLDEENVTRIFNWYKNGKSIAVLNMPFETDSSSTVTDYSGYGNNGTVTGATWVNQGRNGSTGAYNFSSGNYYIENLTKDFRSSDSEGTLSMWLYPYAFDGYNYVFSSADTATAGTYLLGFSSITGTGEPYIYQRNADTASYWSGDTNAKMTLNTWNHVVWTSNGTIWKLYLNGVKQGLTNRGSGANNGDWFAETTNRDAWTIGIGHWNTYTSDWNGLIDEVQIYNHSLSAEQIKAHYNLEYNRIVSQETTKGDVWYAAVTPNDMQTNTDGTTLQTNNVTIVNSVPTHDTPILNATNANNDSNQNLTVYLQNVQDVDNDSLKNIVNWYEDGTSITALNMPFEGNLTAEGGTKVRDYSHGNNGTENGGVVWNATRGHDGFGAYEFDGVNDYISLGDSASLNITGNISVSVWAYRYGSRAMDNPIVSKNPGTNWQPTNGYVIGYGWGLDTKFGVAGNVSAASISGYNQWHHLVGTYDGLTMRLYADGVLVDTTAHVGSAAATSQDLWIGRAVRGSAYYNGTIDDVRIYNRSLSPEQISVLYNNRTDLIVSQETVLGETWQACVTPNDGTVDGQTKCSNDVIITPVCGDSITGDTTLVANLTSSGTCFTIGADDITLDCAGHTLTGDGTGYGIDASSRNNITIKNCTIQTFDRNIYFSSTTNSTIVENTILDASSDEIYLTSSDYNNISDNYVETKAAQTASGIGLTASSNNLIENNTILGTNTTLGGVVYLQTTSTYNLIKDNYITANITSVGIYLEFQDTDNNNLTNNVVYAYGTSTAVDIYGDNNILTNNTLTSEENIALRFIGATGGGNNNIAENNILIGSTGVDMYDSDNTILRNNYVIKTMDPTSGVAVRFYGSSTGNNFTDTIIESNGTWILSSTGFGIPPTNNFFNNTLFNNPFNGSIRIIPNVNVNGTLTIDQTRLEITGTRAFIDTSYVSAFNTSAQITLFNATSIYPIVDYEDDGTYAYCPLDVCTDVSYNPSIIIFNVTHFTSYSTNNEPTHNTPILNSTNPTTNYTSENLTVYVQNVSDSDGTPVKNITDWRIGGTSITLLNIPFEGGSNSTWTRDYSSFGNNGSSSKSGSSDITYNGNAGFDGFGAYEINTTSDTFWAGASGEPSLNLSNSEFTIEVRFKTSGLNTFSTLVAQSSGSYTDDQRGVGAMLYTNSTHLIGIISNFTNNNTIFGNTAITDGNFHHAVFVVNSTTLSLYLDGSQDATAIAKTLPFIQYTSIFTTRIGNHAGGNTNWNGTLDDIKIYNRSLSPEQISVLYNNRTDLMVSQETVLGETWQACVTPNDGTGDGITKCSNNLTIANAVPNTEEVILNSTSGTNYTTENLSCYVNATDFDGDSLTAYYQWYNGATLILSGSTSGISPNTITLVSTLASGNTSSGETWNCSILVGDGTDNETSWNSALLTIKSTPPTHDTPYAAAHQPTESTIHDNLVGYWQFEHGSDKNSVAIDAVGSNNGSVYNGTAHTDDGRVGSAYEFDGTDDYIHVNSNMVFPNMSFAGWINPKVASGYIATEGIPNTGIRAYMNFAGSKLRLGCFYTSWITVDSDNVIPTNEWTHFVGVIESGTTGGMKLYINGIEQSNNNTITSCPSYGTFYLGTYIWPFGNYFNGTMDDLRIYNRTLSASEILEMYLDAEINDSSTVTSDQDLGASSNNTADIDNDNVTRIFNWYKDGSSLTALNMPFETDSSSIARDYSNYSNNGTITGATWTSSGRDGSTGAYEFDGSNEYIEIADNISLNPSSITVSAWINANSFDSVGNAIVSKGGSAVSRVDYDLRFATTALPRFGFYNGTTWYTAESTTALTTGTWHHIVGTYNTTHLEVFVDGISKDTTAINAVLPDSAGNLYIGTYAWDLSLDFNGTIDEVRVYKHALSAEQIQAHYNLEYNRIVSQETTKGEVWYAEITPNDNQPNADGTTLQTNDVTIINTVPTHDTPVLNSSSGNGRNDDNLTEYEQSTADIDNDPVKNIINWYKDETSTTVVNMPFEGGSNSIWTKDYSPYGNNGTNPFTGGVWSSTAGYDGKGAYEFDGTSSTKIDVSNSGGTATSLNSSLITELTIEAWVKTKGSSINQSIVYKDTSSSSEYGLKLDDNRRPSFLIDTGTEVSALSSEALNLDAWYHVAGTWNGTTISVYVNGLLKNTASQTGSMTHSSWGLVIGADATNSLFFNGTIDEVRMYNISLSPEQVSALYNNRTDLIVSQETSKGETWQACVTPNDGEADGTTLCSNSLYIKYDPSHHILFTNTPRGIRFTDTSQRIRFKESSE